MTSQSIPAEIGGQGTEGHRYEDQGGINFYFAAGCWHLDSTSVDGHSLERLDSPGCTFGVLPDRCTICRTPAAIAERDQAQATPLPTGREVLDMLAEWFGYTLVDTAGLPTTTAAPDALLAEFRSHLRNVDERIAKYYADPDNEQDPIATGRYADDRAELYEQAATLAQRLDGLASHGHLPQAWTRAGDTTHRPDAPMMVIPEPQPAAPDRGAPLLTRWFQRIAARLVRIRARR